MKTLFSFQEVLNSIDIKPHLLHFWSQKFPFLQRDESSQETFSKEQFYFIKSLKKLLVDENKTIRFVLKMIEEQGIDSLTHEQSVSSTKEETEKKILSVFSQQNESVSSLSKHKEPLKTSNDFEKKWRNFMHSEGTIPSSIESPYLIETEEDLLEDISSLPPPEEIKENTSTVIRKKNKDDINKIYESLYKIKQDLNKSLTKLHHIHNELS